MANSRSSTNLLNARLFLSEQFNAPELRRSNWGATMAFLMDRNFTFPKIEELRTSQNRTTQAMYKKKKDFTVSNAAPTCTPSGETSGTGIQTLTWTPYKVVVTSPHKPFYNNEQARQDAFNHDLENALRSLHDAIETDAVSFLEANKTTVNGADGAFPYGTWNAARDTMEFATGAEERIYSYFNAEMKLNDYNSPPWLDIHNTAWDAERLYALNQGAQNGTNYSWQFNGFEQFWTNSIDPAAYYDHSFYLVPRYGIAMLDWIEPMNVEFSGRIHANREYGVLPNPIIPDIRLQYMKYETCADTTDDGGDTQDPIDTWEISTWISFNTALLSTAGETTIYKQAILA